MKRRSIVLTLALRNWQIRRSGRSVFQDLEWRWCERPPPFDPLRTTPP